MISIGTKVRIKDQYDAGCNYASYAGFFRHEMLRQFGGKYAFITGAFPINKNQLLRAEANHVKTGDGYFYLISIDGHKYFWSSDMFSKIGGILTTFRT